MTEEWTLQLVIPHHEDGGAFPADIVVEEDDEGRDDMECETRHYVPERETCRNVGGDGHFVCSECGGVYHTTEPQFLVPSYCPLCGRRVIG